MKKLAVLLVVLVLGTSQLFANNNVELNPEQKLRNKVAVLLEKPEIKVENQELNANIEFTVNSNNEIVVLTVDAEEEAVADYVKSRLNYQKIDATVSKKGNRIFKIALKIKRPKGA